MSLDFKKLLAAKFLFTFAAQMQSVAMGWHLYQLTHSAFALGLIGLSEAIPAIGFALHAGSIVDRNKPLTIYIRVIIGTLFSAGVLFLSQFGGDLEVYWIYAASFIAGMARSFSQPSLYAAFPRMLSREYLSKATAWNSAVMQAAVITGAAVGGLFYGWFGIGQTTVWVLGLLVAAFACMLIIKNPPSAPLQQFSQHSSQKKEIKRELFAGVRYVFNHPILLSALSLDMISVLFGGVTALLPIFADLLQTGPGGLGVLRAAPAVGAVLMGLVLTRIEIRRKAGAWLLVSVAGFGICILAFGASHVFWISCLALFMSGVFDSVSMMVRGAAVQLASPENMRGRISAVNSIFIGSSNEIGEFESGIAASVIGTIPAVFFGGVMCLLTVMIVAWKSPQLRSLDLTQLRPTQ